jgi:acetyltransferase-like isoleucine patch superfamily enzyme
MASNVTFNRIPLKLGKLSIGIGSYSADEIDVWHTSNFTSIRIGNYTSIGRGLKLIATGGHSTKLISTYGFASFDGRKSGREAVFNLGDISIGNDVWIGDDVTIMGGVQVQDGVIIGTKSLVTKDLDAFGVYGGVPAKLLKYRFSLRIIRELKKIKWWDLPPELLKRNINIFYEKNIPSAVAKLSSLRRDYDRSLRKN